MCITAVIFFLLFDLMKILSVRIYRISILWTDLIYFKAIKKKKNILEIPAISLTLESS